jgi:hypothetical protein
MNAYKMLIGKPKAKTLGGRPMNRWEDNTKRDLKEVELRVWTESI